MIPAGALVTVPVPVPALETVRWWVRRRRSKVAVTVWSADIVRVQVPVPVQSPLQPVNTEPASGVAVNTTEVPSPKSARRSPRRSSRPERS